MIRFKCPKCAASIKVADEFAGKKGKCPSCRNVVEVPKSAAASGVDLVPMNEAKPRAPKPAAVKPPFPAAIQKKPAPAATSRTPPAKPGPPPKPKRPAQEVEEVEVVEEVEEEVEVVEEAPRRKPRKRPMDDDDDVEEDIEVVEESPRKRKRPRDEEDEDEEERPRRGRRAAAEEEDDEPEEEDEEDRPKKHGKKNRKRGEYADCPECGCPGHAEKVSYTWWGSFWAPKMFKIVECNKCGTRYNGKTGGSYTLGMIIYLVVAFLIIGGIFGLAAWIAFFRDIV